MRELVGASVPGRRLRAGFVRGQSDGTRHLLIPGEQEHTRHQEESPEPAVDTLVAGLGR